MRGPSSACDSVLTYVLAYVLAYVLTYILTYILAYVLTYYQGSSQASGSSQTSGLGFKRAGRCNKAFSNEQGSNSHVMSSLVHWLSYCLQTD